MKKIRSLDHLLAEKRLLELQRLQLEKEMQHNLRDLPRLMRHPSALSHTITPILKQLASSFLKRTIAGWLTKK